MYLLKKNVISVIFSTILFCHRATLQLETKIKTLLLVSFFLFYINRIFVVRLGRTQNLVTFAEQVYSIRVPNTWSLIMYPPCSKQPFTITAPSAHPPNLIRKVIVKQKAASCTMPFQLFIIIFFIVCYG